MKTKMCCFFSSVILLLMACQASSVENSAIELPDPHSWRGLTPGVSTQQDVLEILGEPDYLPPELGQNKSPLLSDPNAVWTYWNSVDKMDANIFYDIGFVNNLVSDIRISWYDGNDPDVEVHTLDELVSRYGKPYYVTWGDGRISRWLAWPQHGVLAEAFAIDDPSRAWVHEIVYTIPMTEQEFDNSFWPVYLPNERLGMGDGLPQDPYDWSEIE